jgi:hypothetical protein
MGLAALQPVTVRFASRFKTLMLPCPRSCAAKVLLPAPFGQDCAMPGWAGVQESAQAQPHRLKALSGNPPFHDPFPGPRRTPPGSCERARTSSAASARSRRCCGWRGAMRCWMVPPCPSWRRAMTPMRSPTTPTSPNWWPAPGPRWR